MVSRVLSRSESETPAQGPVENELLVEEEVSHEDRDLFERARRATLITRFVHWMGMVCAHWMTMQSLCACICSSMWAYLVIGDVMMLSLASLSEKGDSLM
jgi:hypothetical protein